MAQDGAMQARPASVHRRWKPPLPMLPSVILGAHARSRTFPTFRVIGSGVHAHVWWTTTGIGQPCTARFTVDQGTGEVLLDAWGPGAAWCADRLPQILGANDVLDGFDPRPLLASPFERVRLAWRVHGCLPTPATGAVLDTLILAILEQRVTGLESVRAWGSLVRRFGEPAPGPAGVVPPDMHVPPSAEAWRQIPSWEWHRAGVDATRSGTILRSVQRASALHRLGEWTQERAAVALRSLVGVGPWTAAEVGQRALGDSDAVSVGDYHLANNVVYALSGRLDGADDDMLELLDDSRPHRYRIIRVCELSGVSRPARGPRATITDHRRR